MRDRGRPTRGRIWWLAALLAAMTVGGCDCQPVAPKAPPGEVYIPGGTFQMGHAPTSGTQCGSQQGGPVQCNGTDFSPAHAVTLSPYFIDTYEVTFGDYKKCMDAGFCATPWSIGSPHNRLNAELADPGHAKYPIWSVTPQAAERYCEWKGERLPTEAEWERAARGPDDYDYPWGNDPPTCSQNDDWAQGCVDTVDKQMVPVGSRPHDVSAEGVHDMYGNAFELVADLFMGDYYSRSPKNDPTGPKPSDFPPGALDPNAHVIRGGCDGVIWPNYDYVTKGCPVWFRDSDGGGAGFRCAKDAMKAAGVPLYHDVTWRRLQ